MAFEPQQYSASELAVRITHNESFCFRRNIAGLPIFSYWLRRGNIVLPDGTKSKIHGVVDMCIERRPLEESLVEDSIVIRELRELLGEEASKSFCEKDDELRLRYDYLDESYRPAFPEKIFVRLTPRSIREKYPNCYILPRPLKELTKMSDKAFFDNSRLNAFDSMSSYARSRGINIEIPERIE